MKRLVLFITFQLFTIVVFGQLSLSGIVKDMKGDALSGANVMLVNTYDRTTAGIKGEFKFMNLKSGKYTVQITFVGYKNFTKELIMNSSLDLEVAMEPANILTEEVLISSARAGEKSPVAYTNIGKEDLKASNFGQDIPYMLNYSPSFVATSDAGNGVGYTNFRIRGTQILILYYWQTTHRCLTSVLLYLLCM